jgi:hypothetical protein
MASDKEIQEMPIGEAILLPGGNGLATPPFKPNFGFLGSVGWRHVEQGVEAVVCDGEVIETTALHHDIKRIFQHKQFIRRVLLKPQPITVTSQARNAEYLPVELEISFSYAVADPAQVAAQERPLVTLQEAAQGLVAEFIRSRTLQELLEDSNGASRELLKQRLLSSPVIAGTYVIVDVLKALVGGDTRLIDAANEAAATAADRTRLREENINRELRTETDLKIERNRKELEDEYKERDQARLMEQKRLEEQGATLRTLLQAAGEIGKGGMSPESLKGLFPGAFISSGGWVEREPSSGTPNFEVRHSLPHQPARANLEREALESIKPQVGMITFDLAESAGEVRGAILQFPEYSIMFACGEGYPQDPPEVEIRRRDGAIFQPTTTWIPGLSMLAHLVQAIIPQANTRPGSGKES